MEIDNSKFKETIFGHIIPIVDYSKLPADQALRKAINDENYLLCAAIRLGKPFTTAQVSEEVFKILVEQVLQDMVDDGTISYNAERKTLKLVKKGEQNGERKNTESGIVTS